MKETRASTVTSQALLLLILVVTVFPLVAVLCAALQPHGSVVQGLQLPHHFSLDTFGYAWTKAGYGRLMVSSLIIIIGVVPIALLFALLAGYSFGTMRFRGSKALYLMLILGLTLPVELMIIPLYHDYQMVGLLNSYLGIILMEIAMYMPFGVFWMTAYFASVPLGLIEAAQLDGASRRVVLWRVLLPGARPALTTLGVLYFIWSWNQFLLPLVLISDPSKRPAPAGLGAFAGEYAMDVPSLCAATLLTMIPPLIVYLFFQRQFISGMLQGAVKG